MRLLFLVMSLCVVSMAYAQSESDSIHITKNFWGYKFYQHHERMNINQLPLLMEDNIEALTIIEKAKNRQVLSTIIGGAGGFLVGLQLANAIIGGEPNWAMAGVGGGLIVVSIPIYSKSYRLSLQAVEIYNHEFASLLENKPQLYFGMNHHGLGLRCIF